MWSYRPHPTLRGQLRRITGFVERAGTPVFRREVPNSGVTLVLGLDSEIRIGSTRGTARFDAFVAGLHEIPVDTEHLGTYRCVQVDLSPLGAYQLLGIPMSELTDTVVRTDALGGPGWGELCERLCEAPSWEHRLRLVEHVLADQLRDGPVPDPAVHWAWRQLERGAQLGGAVPIATLAAEIGWSRRHFASRFRHQVGLTPKATAKVLRFSRALRLLTGAGTIASVAADAGYADHSHLVREFRRLAEATPTELLAEFGSQVTFVQDATAAPG